MGGNAKAGLPLWPVDGGKEWVGRVIHRTAVDRRVERGSKQLRQLKLEDGSLELLKIILG